MFHMIEGIQKLGLMQRAMATEDMFDDRPIDAGALDGLKPPKGKKVAAAKPPKGGKKAKGDNVVHIGDAARSVAEQAGAD
jgi:hypothetical protein